MSVKKKNSSLGKINFLLLETAWEVANQLGGIYTVVRTKAQEASRHYKSDYALSGPYTQRSVEEFEKLSTQGRFGLWAQACVRLEEKGYKLHYGRWLIAGTPRTILFELDSLPDEEWLAALSPDYPFERDKMSDIIRQSFKLGYFNALLTKEVLLLSKQKPLIVHSHEWMSSSLLLFLEKHPSLHTIFTTHATLLGRYLAMNDPSFYQNLHTYNWQKEAQHFGIMNQVLLERLSAQKADLFSTVSRITDAECQAFLGRASDALLPNGILVERFAAIHEFQNLHLRYKKNIQHFVTSHFFPHYHFNLDRTLYFFSSGRYEYHNKGFNITLKALYLLNEKLKRHKIPITVIFFLITKRPYHSINPEVMESSALTHDIRLTGLQLLSEAEEPFIQSLFSPETSHKLHNPDIKPYFSEKNQVRLRRELLQWQKHEGLPKVITHNLCDDQNDEILQFLRENNFYNKEEDPVKIVYHPDFINSSNPLWRIDYQDFIRGCHLGIFPSYYEPWGYTPLECIVSGIPTITSDLSGFGDYIVQQNLPGIIPLRRHQQTEAYTVETLSEILLHFCKQDRRQRIQQRNEVEAQSERFDWNVLYKHYESAYRELLSRKQ